MRELRIRVRQIGNGPKCEVGMFEDLEKCKGSGTEEEGRIIHGLIEKVGGLLEDMAKISAGVALDDEKSPLADKIRARFRRGVE